MAAQVDLTKANILAYLHTRIVRRVLKYLLENAVSRENPDWTIDHFLYHHTRRINGTVIGSENERHMFPGFRENANVDNWPFYLFPFLIVHITDLETIPVEVRTLVRELNQTRRELYSNIVSGVSDEYYNNHTRYIKITIETLCDFLQNDQLKDILEKEITDILQNKEVPGGNDYVHEFNMSYETEKSYRQRVEEFTPDQQRLHDFIQENAVCMQPQVATNEPVVSIRDHDRERAERSGHDLSESDLPPLPQTKYPVTLPAIPIEILMKGCSGPQNQRISELIVNTVNNIDVPDITKNNRDVVQHAFTDAITAFGVFNARQRCIQLLVQPTTIHDVFKLFNDCINGVLTKKLKPVQDLIRTFPGCETYEQEAVLYKDNYDCVMDNLARQLMKELEVKGYNSAPKRRVTVEESDHSTILLNVACHSPVDREYFKIAIMTGQLKPTFDVLRQQLQLVYPDVSLSTRLLDTEVLKSSNEHPKKITVRINPNVTSSKTKITFLRDIDLTLPSDNTTPSVTGISLKDDGRLVAADLRNKCIKLVDTKSGKCIGGSIPTCCTPPCDKDCKRNYHPWNVTVIDNNITVVSVPAACKLIFVDIKNDQLSIVRELNNHKQCRGLAYCCGSLYVTYGSPESKVRIMNTDGTILKTLANKHFSEPWYITVNADDKSIFVSESLKKCVIHLDNNGIPVQIMDLKQVLDESRGLVFAGTSRLWLCAYRFNGKDAIVEVNLENAYCNDVVDECVECPIGIQIDRNSDLVFISMCKNRHLRVLTLQT